MNTVALHPIPTWRAAVREQFLTIGLSMKWTLIGSIVLMAGFMVLMLGSYGPGQHFLVDPDGFGPLLSLLGVFAPLAIWKNEEPARRGYLWAMPLPRPGHTLVKVFNGWLWLMIVAGAVMLWAMLMALVTHGYIGVDETRTLMPNLSPGAAVTPADLQAVHWTTPGWMWLVLLVAPTVTYLAGSVIVLGSDHPVFWYAGVVVGFLLLTLIADAGHIAWLGQRGANLLSGRYGLETLITGSNESAQCVTDCGPRSALYSSHAPPVYAWRNLAEAGLWTRTVLLWGLPSLLGVLVVAHHHHER